VNVTARWYRGRMGKYEGSVDTNGYAHGQTYDGKTPTSSAAWGSDVPLVCDT
jgi:hypothetical protein